jgi:hypothetical protein
VQPRVNNICTEGTRRTYSTLVSLEKGMTSTIRRAPPSPILLSQRLYRERVSEDGLGM